MQIIFVVPFAFRKYAGIQFCLLLCMGVKLGPLHCRRGIFAIVSAAWITKSQILRLKAK